MSELVLQSVRALLSERGVDFDELEHAAVKTSAEAAAARGMSTAQGAKSLLFKVDDWFGVFVLAGDRSLHSLLLRRRFGARRTRFANPEELDRLAGVQPGAMPPFGRPIFELPLYAEPSVLEPERIGFTAGLRTRSILLASADWRAAAEPEIFPFAR